MIEEDKVELSRKRAELVEILATPLPTEERVRIQGELSILNARIKAQNTTSAAQLKAAADRRKAAGLAEAQANAVRARTKIYGGDTSADADAVTDDPAQASRIDDANKARRLLEAALRIDAWITTVLEDSGVKVKRTRGKLDFVDVPAKWLVVLQRLRAGIHATARGEALPEVEVEVPSPKVKAALSELSSISERRKPTLAERRSALGFREPSVEERRAVLEAALDDTAKKR